MNKEKRNEMELLSRTTGTGSKQILSKLKEVS